MPISNTIWLILLTVNNILATQPGVLSLRANNDSLLVLLLVTVCVVLVALARARERQLFQFVLLGTIGLHSLDELSDDFYKARSLSFILTVVLFLLSSSGAIYWFFFLTEPQVGWRNLVLPVSLPGLYFLYQLLVSNSIAAVAGERQLIGLTNYYSLLLAQFFGLLFTLELIISYFRPAIIVESAWVFGATYGLYLLVRFVRGFFITVRAGVSWYYIILYFWTLEILPLLIVSKLLLVR